MAWLLFYSTILGLKRNPTRYTVCQGSASIHPSIGSLHSTRCRHYLVNPCQNVHVPTWNSLQEIKCQRSKLTRDMALVPGYDAYFSFPKARHGYSGVAVYVKKPLRPQRTEDGIVGNDPTIAEDLATPPDILDSEGRCIIMDFTAFVLFNIYFPNDANEARRNFKMDYHHCVRRRVDAFLQQGRQVLLVGDINAIHEEIDHCDPKQSMKDHGITHFKALPHRQWIDQIITPKGPLVDVCRKYHPSRRGMFTCMTNKGKKYC